MPATAAELASNARRASDAYARHIVRSGRPAAITAAITAGVMSTSEATHWAAEPDWSPPAGGPVAALRAPTDEELRVMLLGVFEKLGKLKAKGPLRVAAVTPDEPRVEMSAVEWARWGLST